MPKTLCHFQARAAAICAFSLILIETCPVLHWASPARRAFSFSVLLLPRHGCEGRPRLTLQEGASPETSKLVT